MPYVPLKPTVVNGAVVAAQTLTVATSAAQFSTFNPATDVVAIQVQNNNVYCTLDGTTPSATNGGLLYAGQMYHWNTQTAQRAQFVAVTGTATLYGQETVTAGDQSEMPDMAVWKPMATTTTTVTPAPVNVKSFGAYGDGSHDDTSAIVSALASLNGQGALYFPTGVYITGPIDLSPFCDSGIARWKHIHLFGDGESNTIFQPRAANQQVFYVSVPGHLYDSELDHFSVRAHASGSSGAAINLEYFSGCHLHHIGYLSNSGGVFTHLFWLHAPTGYQCYNNQIEHISALGQAGPTNVVTCYAETGNNCANANGLANFHLEGCSGVSTVFNLTDTVQFTIGGQSVIENLTGAVLLYPGYRTTMRGVYCESLASAPVVAVANIQNPIWVCIEDNYFGPPFATLVLTASPLCQYWMVRNNGPYLAVTDNGNLNYVEQVGSATYSGQSVANWMGATFGDPAIGIFTDIGTSPTTGGSGIALKNNYGSVTSATRNFALATVVAAYGDFAIRQSAAAGGNPFTSGQNLAYWDAGGNVTFPHGATIQGTDPAITLTNATATATTSAVVSATVPIKIGSTTYKMMLST